MPDRHFPVRPNLEQLKHQAKDLLREIRARDPAAIAVLGKHRPPSIEPIDTGAVKLADAQLVLARMYGIASWPRLVISCRIIDAIWRDDLDLVREIVTRHPRLVHENARATEKCNWGPPMSYAANLGRSRIIAMLRDLGASDVQHAFIRAALQGKLDTARQLHAMGMDLPRGAVMAPAESQNGAGLALLLELGAEIADEHGDRLGPVAMVLQTYSRHPQGKHQCLELFAAHGIELPDTPAMAVHRGRIDLIEQHLRRDPGLFSRTFTHVEIYPREVGCHADESLALHGTPLAGATLLHLCVDNDEIEIARWMIERGADVDARADIDADGFGGHTALFGCVVSQPYRTGLRTDDAFARLLLDRGADPNARASLRKRHRFVEEESLHEYRDVTPLAWGREYHLKEWVSPSVMHLIAERGGR